MTEETVRVCPECGSRTVKRNNLDHPRSSRATAEWRCNYGGHTFDEPDEILESEAPPKQPNHTGGSPGVQALMDADPAEVSR